MINSEIPKKGLVCYEIDVHQSAIIDPDNVFWAITNNHHDSNRHIPDNILSLYKKVKDRLDTELKDFRFSQGLSAIYIDPTDRCNANCPYCYIPKKIRKNGRSMNEEELFFILKKIAAYFKSIKRRAVIVFHASEPLLVKDIIFEAIKKFSKQFNFGLQTNAILLKKEDVEFLKQYSVGVGISLDSCSPEINNLLRASGKSNGNFDKAIRALDWFDGYKGLNVITTLTKFNTFQLPDMVRFLHTKKVPCVLFNPVRLTQKSSLTLKPDEEELTRYFIQAVDIAIELSKTSNQRIIIGNFANTILGIVAPTARRLMCDISPCGGGRCFLTITASGEMIPCGEFTGLKGFSGGNIFKTDIRQATQSEPFEKIRARIVEEVDKCNTCIFRNICGAPCPAELYSLGNMYQASIFCEFYKEIIRYAFKLISEGKEKYCFREDGLNNLTYDYCLER
ncbi:MAG: peptide-modifying radical SAM enzyme CbpB [Nitrospirota bacterium]